MRHELTWELQASLVLALGSNFGTGSDSTNVRTTN
jgi:hypothetical protein